MISHAQWQWVDKDGRKVFSDQPPPFDIPEKNVLKSPKAYQNRAASNAATAAAVAASSAGSSGSTASATPGGSATPPPALGKDKELEDKKRQADEENAAKMKTLEAANAKARAENCSRARQAKATFDSGVRVARMNKDGEREIMDDAARDAEMKRIQAAITADCSVKSPS